ncbi:hypothetical protein [Devosia pacifica]|nr:hypothetical protein [Devosia pacifica]
MARVRSRGADLRLVNGALRIVNGNRLDSTARDYIMQHRQEVRAYLEAERDFEIEERAALIEFDGGAPRQWAEQFARVLYSQRPDGVSDLEWSWFMTACGRMIDEAPGRRAA